MRFAVLSVEPSSTRMSSKFWNDCERIDSIALENKRWLSTLYAGKITDMAPIATISRADQEGKGANRHGYCSGGYHVNFSGG